MMMGLHVVMELEMEERQVASALRFRAPKLSGRFYRPIRGPKVYF